MEVLQIMIRQNEGILQGLEIPGKEGGTKNGECTYIKERSLADDVAVYMSNPAVSLKHLQEVIKRFGSMSGQRLNLRKSTVVLLGKDATNATEDGTDTDPHTWWPGMKFTVMGFEVEKYHGIRLADIEGTAHQWKEKAQGVLDTITSDAKVFTPKSIDYHRR